MKAGLLCGLIAAAALGVVGLETTKPTFFWQKSNYQPNYFVYNKPASFAQQPAKPSFFASAPTKPAFETTTPLIAASSQPVGLEPSKPVVPEYPKPAVPEYPKPAVPEYPKPTAHENHKPAVPEYPKPAVPVYPKPTAPENPKPAVPEYPKPAVPEYPKLAAPEQSKPAAPEYPKPSVSEIEPSIPSLPELSKPSMPEYNKPQPSENYKPELEPSNGSEPPAPELESRIPEMVFTEPSATVPEPAKPSIPASLPAKPSIPVWQPIKPFVPFWQSVKPTTELIKKTELTAPSTAFYAPPQTTPAVPNNYSPYWNYYQVLPFEHHEQCNYEISDQTLLDFRHAVYNMSTPLYKKIAAVTGSHFVFSPQTMWLTLAAVAEGTAGPARQQLFNYLNLPENICQREAYYHLAMTRERSDNDIVFARNRLFVADSSVHVNKKWEDYVKAHHNLNTVVIPYKNNPVVEIGELKKVFNVQLPNINLRGNSMILESLDYQGLWTSVFSDAVIEQGPFYNSYGEQLGVMEYMKVVKRANIGIVPSINVKVIDLPLGRDGRYRMYFAVSMSPQENFDNTVQKIENSIIFETILNLKQSLKPVEIVIPKFKMTSELDMKNVLEQLGVKALWNDPLATRNISEPAALPSVFSQRVTVVVDEGGVRPAVQEYQNFVPPLHYTQPAYNRGYSSFPSSSLFHDYKPVEASFVANQPFMFGVFDSQSYTGLIYASFSKLQH